MYIQDFGFYSNLGQDKAEVLKKLNSASRGKFITMEHEGIVFHTTNLDTSDLPPFKNTYYDERINRIAEKSLLQIEYSVIDAIQKYGSERIGIFIGSCDNGSDVSIRALRHFKEYGKYPENYHLDKQKADFPLRYIRERFNIKGPSMLQSTACASSATAIATARHYIEAGVCDAAIVGGLDLATQTVNLGFDSLGAISRELSIPFSKNRTGINIGEASAFLLVTRDQDNAKFKITGIGESADADHITAPREDGEGARLAMQRALDDAGLSAADIDYISLHGTGTMLNDAMEGRAVHSIFGEETFASSTKGCTGHTLGASGALELCFCCLAISDYNTGMKLPAHCYDGEYDETIPAIHLVKPGESAKRLNRCISNAFAFGGCNISIIVEKA